MKELRGEGVCFNEVVELPGGVGRVTSFKDPWGNEIDFYEPRALSHSVFMACGRD